MVSQEVKAFIQLRKDLIKELVDRFQGLLHEDFINDMNYDIIADNIIQLFVNFEDKTNLINTEIESN